MRPRVLLVDDDEALLETLALALHGRGFEVATCADPAAADAAGCAVVVTDLRMPGVHGLALARRLLTAPAPPAVLVLTAFGQLDDAIRALRLGVVDFLTKPVSLDELTAALHRALRIGARPRPLMEPSAAPSRVVSRLRERIARFARLSGTVLVRGETGAGKEGVARALHDLSPRASGPFVALNCAALPEGLAESELFGHVRGAFTDARADRTGLIRDADGGTLFLDEVGDLPAALQPKLLRVLEGRVVRPIGASAEIGVDVRVVAATHRDLAALVQTGAFRADLYYRLAELGIDVPPLRDHPEDVLPLADELLAEVVAREGLPALTFAEDARRLLVAWWWPGNVRELKHVVYEAAVLCDGGVITAHDLPSRLTRDAAPDSRSLDALERAHIERVLASVGGNRTAAARILGCDRKTLYRRLKEPGHDP